MFATCSYREFQPWMGIPVRTSVGAPRFPLGYELRHAIPALTPKPYLLNAEYETFRRAYRHQLHRFTIGRLLDAAQRIRVAENAGDHVPLVLLCFEDLSQPRSWCHRSLAAWWLEQKTGEHVMEFGDLLVAEPVPATQLAAC